MASPRTASPDPARRRPPTAFLPFELCTLVERPPSGAGWLHEIKFDGYRMQVHVEAGEARWFTRNGLDWTDRFRPFAAVLADLPDCVLDGELCALDEKGRPRFSVLRSAMGRRNAEGLVFFAFDLLRLGRRDLRPEPLGARKAALAGVLAELGPDGLERVRPVDELPADPRELIAVACRMGLEGIVSKRRDAPYAGMRSGAWTKAKCRPSETVVIGGWKETAGGAGIRSLATGIWRDGKLVYAGGVRSGFGAATGDLLQRLKAIEQVRSPFEVDGPRKTPETHWVRPELVAEVEIAEWTDSGKLRQASFKGLREDAPPAAAVAAVPAPAPTESVRSAPRPWRSRAARVLGVELTSPDKPLWPEDGITKRELAEYMAQAAEWLVPYVRGRPASVVLAVDGIHGEQFYERHVGQRKGGLRDAPHVTRVTSKETGKTYAQFDTAEALVEAVQSDGLEIHPWNCIAGDLETPGRFVFDLDPDEGLPFERVIEAAHELRDRLSDLGVRAFCKTTGGKGLHVVAPFAQPRSRRLAWPEAKAAALRICEAVAADHPSRYTLTVRKEGRRGRIFLDYLRNDFTRTAIAAVSPRGRVGAPVSMPISWRECRPGLDPAAFTLRTAVARLRKALPWIGYDEQPVDLETALRRL